MINRFGLIKLFRLYDWSDCNCHNNKGFTLIEIIMVLVLIGIMGVGAGLGLSHVINGYIFTKEAAETTSKAQLAMLRISKELRVITSVSSGTVDTLVFSAQHGAGTTQGYTLSLPGGTDELKLNDGINNDTLVDQVNSLVFKYYDKYDAAPAVSWSGSTEIIEIILTLNGPNNVPTVFTTRVFPRNI